jgi:hypothetical protein
MTKKELKNAIEYIEMFIEDFKYDCQHQKETHSALSCDDEEFKETLKILENIRNELKAQKTPKKYLTYDDLMKLETKSYKVLLNGSEYVMELTQSSYCGELYRIFTLIEKDKAMTIIATLLAEYNKQFFNDLHLELVGE